jgi:hypothetical protein
MKESKKKLAYDSAYEKQPEQVKHHRMRNKARYDLMKKGVVAVGDGKDVDHKKTLDSGGTNTPSNLRAVPASKNRAWRVGKKGKDSYKA